jgi:hypothetical protein
MSLAQLRRMGATVDEQGDSDSEACSYWTLPARDGMSFMVSRKRVVRIDIISRSYRIVTGARVGMPELEMRRIYGRRIKVNPHPYTGPEGHYLVYHDAGQSYGAIFETDSRAPHRVTSFRVGYWGSVQLIEGCE